MVSEIQAAALSGPAGVSGKQPLQQGRLLRGQGAHQKGRDTGRVCLSGKGYAQGESGHACGAQGRGRLSGASGRGHELV